MVSRVFQVVYKVLLSSCWEVFRSSPLLGRFCIVGGLYADVMQLCHAVARELLEDL